MGILDDLFCLTKDVVSIALTPVEIATQVTNNVVHSVAGVVTEIKNDIK